MSISCKGKDRPCPGVLAALAGLFRTLILPIYRPFRRPTREHATSGYANRTILLRFDELAEPGDDIHVLIRNPRLMPTEELRSLGGKSTAADAERLAAAQAAIAAGGEVPDDLVTDEDADRGYAMVAKLIIGWRVYDPRVLEGDQPLLPLPATPALVGALPQEILLRIMEEVGRANPQQTPGSRGATGNPS